MTNTLELKELTFLICLKNRLHFTKRLVSYLNNTEYKLNLFFADGGSVDQSAILNNLSKKHNFIYRKFSYDENFFCYADKINKSLKLIDTKYSCLMDSDDFFNFDDVVKHLKFLKNNYEYVCSVGKIINFELIDNFNVKIVGQQYHQEKKVEFNKKLKFEDFSSWQGIHLTKRLSTFSPGLRAKIIPSSF